MSDKQPPPIITVNYVTQEAPKRGWPMWVVALALFFSIVACGQCSRWIGY